MTRVVAACFKLSYQSTLITYFSYQFLIPCYKGVGPLNVAEMNSTPAEHGSYLLMHLQRMRSTQELTDVVLLTEGVPFHCHKVVLSAFSPYFQVKHFNIFPSSSHMHIIMMDCYTCV